MPVPTATAPPFAVAAAKKKKKKKKKVAAKKKPVKKKPSSKTCRTVTKKIRGRRVRVRVCKKTVPAKKPVITVAQPAPVLPPDPNLPPAPEQPPADLVPSDEPVEQFTGTLTRRQAERLLWRAGFGPRPGDLEAFTGLPVQEAVHRLTRFGTPTYSGVPASVPVPGLGIPMSVADGRDHIEWWGHLYWLDMMVRCDDPLYERMGLIFHDWFATSISGLTNQPALNRQTDVLRQLGLGRFDDIVQAMTVDHAMLGWLDGVASRPDAPNENFARELMELFTLGVDRGYTEDDIREAAKAFTGWIGDPANPSLNSVYYDSNYHKTGSKTIFGVPSAADYEWRSFGTVAGRSGQPAASKLVDVVLGRYTHASFFCNKLWSYFIPTPPSEQTLASLMNLYVGNVDDLRQIRPVVEAILQHPDFYEGPSMTIPPVVYAAGLLRAVNGRIQTHMWAPYCSVAGQQVHYPPNVAGWDDRTWLDTGTFRGRWLVAHEAIRYGNVDPANGWEADETPENAVKNALQAIGDPTISNLARYRLTQFAERTSAIGSPDAPRLHAERQNALRLLIATAPDRNVC